MARSCKKAWLADLTEIAATLDAGLVVEEEPVVEEEVVVEEQKAEDTQPLSSDDPHAFKRVDGVTYTSVITQSTPLVASVVRLSHKVQRVFPNGARLGCSALATLSTNGRPKGVSVLATETPFTLVGVSRI